MTVGRIASGSPNAGKGTRRVSPPPSLAGTPAGIFTPADAERLRRLFEAHGVEIWVNSRDHDLGEITGGELGK
jgi:hypothetical protein